MRRPTSMRATLALAAVLTLAGCGHNHTGTTPAAPPVAASTPAASPTYDGSTLSACREADAISSGVPQSEVAKHARFARGEAALSDVPALREVARKNSTAEPGTTIDDLQALTAAATIATWCLDHGVSKP